MDQRDVDILMAVSELETGSTETIHDETGIPKSTVHYRLTKLREEGVIRNDLYDIDLSTLGIDLTIISEVMAEYAEGYHDEVGEKLAAVEGVNQVYFTMGETDFIVVANLPNREMVQELIESYESIEEVVRTSSRYVITTVKNDADALGSYSAETVLDACSDDD